MNKLLERVIVMSTLGYVSVEGNTLIDTQIEPIVVQIVAAEISHASSINYSAALLNLEGTVRINECADAVNLSRIGLPEGWEVYESDEASRGDLLECKISDGSVSFPMRVASTAM